MLSRLSTACVLATLVPLAAPAQAAAPTLTVAVLEMRAVGLPPRSVEALLDVVTEEVARTPGHKALSRREVESILSEEARKQLVGCSDTSCLAELSDALNADLLVAGEAARVGEGTLVTLQLINHRYANVVNRVSLNWQGAVSALPDVARVAAQMLMLERSAKQPGTLEIYGAPGSAEVFVDDEKAAKRVVDRVDMGVHRVRITASGHEERVEHVLVGNGQKVRVPGALTAIPLYRRPVFWGVSVVAVGTLAVVAAVVVGVIPMSILLVNRGGATVRANTIAPDPRRYP